MLSPYLLLFEATSPYLSGPIDPQPPVRSVPRNGQIHSLSLNLDHSLHRRERHSLGHWKNLSIAREEKDRKKENKESHSQFIYEQIREDMSLMPTARNRSSRAILHHFWCVHLQGGHNISLTLSQ